MNEIKCERCGCTGNNTCGHECVDKEHGCALDSTMICPCCKAHPKAETLDFLEEWRAQIKQNMDHYRDTEATYVNGFLRWNDTRMKKADRFERQYNALGEAIKAMQS